MASNISSSTIDATYPVAGVDNDTQGFRDNFAIIKQNFAYAAGEITDLQNNAARKDENNDFQGSHIVDASLEVCTETYFNKGAVTVASITVDDTDVDPEISFLDGRYQSVQVNIGEEEPGLTFTLSNWPNTEVENRLAKLTVELTCADTSAKTVDFNTTGGVVKKSSNWPTTFLVDGVENPIIVEFWTYNGGLTVFAEYKGRFSA